MNASFVRFAQEAQTFRAERIPARAAGSAGWNMAAEQIAAADPQQLNLRVWRVLRAFLVQARGSLYHV